MTGCEWCGVGPDDECVPGCYAGSTTETAPSELRRVVDRLRDGLLAEGCDLSAATLRRDDRGGLAVEFPDLRIVVDYESPERLCCTVTTDTGLLLGRVWCEAQHWLTAAKVFTTLVGQFVY